MWEFLKKTISGWIEDEPFALAAALSYYTLFSLAPLLTIAIAIAGFFFGAEAAQNQVVETTQGLVGRESAQAIQEMVRKASEKPTAGIISTVFGVIALLFGAGGVVGQLQNSLNQVWGVAPKPGQGVWGFIRQRFISFAMVLSVGFLLLVSLVVSAVLSGMTTLLSNALGGMAVLTHALDVLVSFAFITLLFALIYKFLPDAKIQWRDVWIGAALTSILFTIGKSLIGLYLGNSGVTSVYGAAGSLITVLLWVYYSALIFFFGAELTRVYATEYGSGVEPADNARLVDAEKTAATKRKSARA
ncbi:MAG TPA: YihY/virulence factor BrkB family protein [Candidatus Binatia bacterium]|nr:YihY/virulence factor BrkB family protein [Candidatus Binatia bacterium]